MSLRKEAQAAIVARKRAALTPLKGKTKVLMDGSRVVERLEDEVAHPRSQNYTANSVRMGEVAIAEVLVDHFQMFTEDDLHIRRVRGRFVVTRCRRAQRRESYLKVAMRRLQSRSTSSRSSDALWGSCIGDAAEEQVFLLFLKF
jgi:hypothetical protein